MVDGIPLPLVTGVGAGSEFGAAEMQSRWGCVDFCVMTRGSAWAQPRAVRFNPCGVRRGGLKARRPGRRLPISHGRGRKRCRRRGPGRRGFGSPGFGIDHRA